jgi:hypothetical protein
VINIQRVKNKKIYFFPKKCKEKKWKTKKTLQNNDDTKKNVDK